MTAFELLAVAFMLREDAQRHFEYWLTISFAFIAATFIGRRLLTPQVSLAIGTLYLLTVALLIARYALSGRGADRYMALAIEQGAEPVGGSDVVSALRLAVFLLGTMLALWFLYTNTRREEA